MGRLPTVNFTDDHIQLVQWGKMRRLTLINVVDVVSGVIKK